MDYADIKQIIDTKSFHLIANLINNPECELYLQEYNNVTNILTDPFDGNIQQDINTIVVDNKRYIATVKCIYTFDKMIVQENDIALGSIYSIILYIRYDDIPQEVKDNMPSLCIKFENKFYIVENSQNLYNIILQIFLK
jgi:hypothetical protein